MLLRRGKDNPPKVRSSLAMLHWGIRNWAYTDREYRIYRANRTLARGYERDLRVRCNSLSDLLLFKPIEFLVKL